MLARVTRTMGTPRAAGEGERSALVVLSNRGPLTFDRSADRGLSVRRGGGGLVVTLGPGAQRAGARWIASAMNEADREAAGDGVVRSHGYEVELLDIDEQTYRGYYDVVANGALWYAAHGLWDLPRRPRFDRHWHDAWRAYASVNQRFAEAAAASAAEDATVLVQDYHLALVPGTLGRVRPDLRIVLFVHTPWPTPSELAVLPDRVVVPLLESMAAATAVGFHSKRWAAAFDACCAEVLGTRPRIFVAPAVPDAKDTRAVAASEACQRALRTLEAQVGRDGHGRERRLVVRVDRIELSKNILRGFFAFDELLGRRPDLRERIVFGAFIYPSRQGLADYLAYGQEAQGLARAINERWGTPSWTPILLDADDDYPRSVAALRRADVLLVNPVRDGLNLVAKELAVANERDAVLVLSRQAGCADELAPYAVTLNPFDVAATADGLAAALDMDPSDRARLAAGQRRLADARTPEDWFDDLLRAAKA